MKVQDQRKWSIVSFLALILCLSASASAETYLVHMRGLDCEDCAKWLQKNLTKQFKREHIRNVHIDVKTQILSLEADPMAQEKIMDFISGQGYEVVNIEESTTPAKPDSTSISAP